MEDKQKYPVENNMEEKAHVLNLTCRKFIGDAIHGETGLETKESRVYLIYI